MKITVVKTNCLRLSNTIPSTQNSMLIKCEVLFETNNTFNSIIVKNIKRLKDILYLSIGIHTSSNLNNAIGKLYIYDPLGNS